MLSTFDLHKNSLSEEQFRQVVFAGIENNIYDSDAAIVLGANPLHCTTRIQIANEWIKQVNCKAMVLSGGVKHRLGDNLISESNFMLLEALRVGIPRQILVIDNNARSTIENMICSLFELRMYFEMPDLRSVTIITEPYHMKRSLIIAKLFLPRYIKIGGFSGEKKQEYNFQTDDELKKCVQNEAICLQQLILAGMADDIPI